MTVVSQLRSFMLSRVGLCLLRFAVKVLPAVAAIFTGLGILLSLSTCQPWLAKQMLSIYPRYHLAQQGLAVLQDRKYPLDNNGKEMLAGIIDIDDPAWPVILEFVQSEIAIRKSDRNELGPVLPSVSPPEASGEKQSPSELPSIDFARIKTIAAVEVETRKVGAKALVPPYRLIVRWPHSSLAARPLYEFLSFQEFGLDLRQMLTQRIRSYSIMASGIAFVITMALHGLRWTLRRFAPAVLTATPSGLGGN